MRTAVIGMTAVGALAGWWAFHAARAQDPAGNAPAPAAGAADARPALVGQAGCSAGACHGNPSAPSLTAGPDANCWKASFTHWLAADPHTQAYAALKTDLGKRVVTAWSRGTKTDAATVAECLACHANPALADPASTPQQVRMREEGVSCEACHAAADKWLARHITWKTAADRDGPTGVVASGMANLNDIGERAKMCAGCHVGAPADPARGYHVARDMNHDMIAAGHPRLNFDFAAYQRRLPPHWQEKDRSVGSGVPRTPDFEAKMWLIGRVATAEAACDFTADRAKRAQANPDATPWPELSESNCFACHHAIWTNPFVRDNKEPGSWRQTPGFYEGRTPGVTPWQTLWPVSPDPDVLDDGAKAALAAFRAAMEKPRPNEAKAAGAAGTAAKSLEAVRKKLAGLPDADAVKLLGDLAEKASGPDRLPRLNWDEAGELYQALVTLEVVRAARPGAKKLAELSTVETGFAGLTKALRLPAEPRADSPVKYQPGDVRTAFRPLAEELRKQVPGK